MVNHCTLVTISEKKKTNLLLPDNNNNYGQILNVSGDHTNDINTVVGVGSYTKIGNYKHIPLTNIKQCLVRIQWFFLTNNTWINIDL